MSEWISVEEKLPPEGVRVLLHDYDQYGDGFGVVSGRFMGGRWYLEGEWAICASITHWMPLPEPPEVNK